MTEQKKREKTEAQAERLVKKGKFDEAIRKYQKLITGEEQDIQLRNIIGDLYVKSGETEKAVEEFQKIARYYEEKGLYPKSVAIYKKINKLKPDDYHSAQKLADYYKKQGFTTEAKKAYLNLAQVLGEKNKNQEAIQNLEKVLEVDPNDISTRLSLAQLYKKEKMVDDAVEELNKVAETKIKNNDLKEAEKILEQARKLKENHSKTLANLLELLKKQNKKKEALSLIDEILKKDKHNLRALYLLGNLYFEDKNYKKAEETFSRILSLQPKEVKAKVSLGKVYLQQEKYDQAYELWEPLVEVLVRRQKVEKAIGLLGLILSSSKPHVPALEKLGSIYRLHNQKENLELIYQILREEYKDINQKEKLYSVLKELTNLRPEQDDYYIQCRKLKKELGKEDEEREGEESLLLDEKEKQIDKFLKKVDLFIERGLIRNAKRIIESLKLEYPDDPRINQKLTKVKELSLKVREEEIPEGGEEVRKKESQYLGGKREIDKNKSSFIQEESSEEKLTSADIFAETDIIPLVSSEEGEKRYYDLGERIEEELEAIESTLSYQRKGDTSIVEKPLQDILSEFRGAIEERVDKKDYDTRYNLGVAFLEQELMDEAIEEFKLAAEDEKLRVECYSLLSYCYRQKKEFKEALKWLENAVEFTSPGSHQFFALKYELGELYQEIEEKEKALKLFQEVGNWNSRYRDVSKKIKHLKNKE